MAYSNINERREHIKQLFDSGTNFSSSVIDELTKTFNCSYSAIAQDVLLLKKPYIEYKNKKLKTPSIYTSKRMRAEILSRDNHTCQYCGSTECEIIVEHVIPVQLGGYAIACNLVAACQSCNVQKGSAVWIPRNLGEITKHDPQWLDKILSNLN